MPKSRMEQIPETVAALQEVLARRSTRSVVGMYSGYLLRRANDPEFRGEFVSPDRQCIYMLGLLLSTPEPTDGAQMTTDDWDRCVELLNKAFRPYVDLFFPASAAEFQNASDDWKRVREVTLPTFLHYFNTGLLATVRQVRSRIERYLVPFDSDFQASWGLPVSEALRISAWIEEALQRSSDHLVSVVDALDVARQELLGAARSLSHLRTLASAPKYQSLFSAPATAVDQFRVIHRSELLAAFPDSGDAFWRTFSIARGDGPKILYPTERSIADVRPLIAFSADQSICPSVNTLYTSILQVGEDLLTQGTKRKRYFIHRDITLEGEAKTQLHRIIGPSARYISNSFETPDAHYEHDLVIVSNHAIYFTESKATPPPEPFRDPERAIVRLQHAFKADTGIQKAFDQTARLRRRLDAGTDVTLFDKSGKPLVTMQHNEPTNRISVCVTRDDFGPLATNLSLLLEKAESDPYPWVVNILDLEAIADAWEYLGWGETELLKYLKFRTRAHGRIFGTDELEFAGFHISHGSLKPAFVSERSLCTLNPRYSDFFDELMYHREYGAPGPKREVRLPVVTDVRASLRENRAVFVNANPRRPGRNDRCPCGSGTKFKKCCGKNTSVGEGELTP